VPIVLADLVPLVVFGVALALTIMCIALTKAFFGVTGSVLGKLPIVGGWIDATGHHIEQRITNVLGAVALKLEAGIGATWHMSARLVDWIGREINRHAGLLSLISSLLTPFGVISGLTSDVRRARHLIGALLHRLEGIGHDLGRRIGHVERGIGEDVLPRIRGLEREVSRDVARERARARAAERTADREITNLWKWARRHTLQAGTLAFSGAVAFALARLGAGWVRCSNWRRIGRQVCATDPSLIDDLLGDLLVLAGIFSVVEFARDAQALEGEAMDALRLVIREFPGH